MYKSKILILLKWIVYIYGIGLTLIMRKKVKTIKKRLKVFLTISVKCLTNYAGANCHKFDDKIKCLN